MTCDDAREQLSALIDDALGAEERGAVETHLTTCAECRRELERLRGTVALLRAVGPARAPAGFVDRVLEAAKPEPWPQRLVRALLLPWPVKLPVEAAAIVLVAVGVAYVFRATPELQQASRYSVEPGTTASDQFAPGPPAPDLAREAPRAPEPTRAAEPTRILEGARPQDKEQAPGQKALGKQAPEKEPPEKEAPEKKAAPMTQAFSEVGPRPKDADERRAKLDDASRDVAKRQANVPPATPAEPQVAGKLEESPARAERAQGAAGARARSSAAPAPEPRGDTLQAPGAAAAPPAAASFVAPDVSGRLAVADRDAALQTLARLLVRLGGVEDRRFVGDEGPILELTIPREAYPQLVRELAALGRWQLIREAPALPEKVRVTLRITS
jgi:putative zinc finger protein